MKESQQDLFPIFDPVNEDYLQYSKHRALVHRDGDWHRGIQANVVRPNEQGSFDILLQKRSGIVDISGGKYDQSLATQMLDADALAPANALRRGLATELGVTKYKSLKLFDRLKIIKTYKEQPNVLNRELLSLYLVKAEDESQIKVNSPKIADLAWVPWSSFLHFFAEMPNGFTKTSQFYFSDEFLSPELEVASNKFIYNGGSYELAESDQVIVHINRHSESPQTLYGSVNNVRSMLEEVGEAEHE